MKAVKTPKETTVDDICRMLGCTYRPNSGVRQNVHRALLRLSRSALQGLYAMVLTSVEDPQRKDCTVAGPTHEEWVKRAVIALRHTWAGIGIDTMAAYADGSYEGAEKVTLHAEEVREAVSACGFVAGYPMDHGDDDDAVYWLDSQPEDVQEEVLAEAFPSGRYGL